METIFGFDVPTFNIYFSLILILGSLIPVVLIFAHKHGYKNGSKEWRGFSAGTLRSDCVYRIVDRVRESPLTLILKEKTPDGIERGRSKLLETSMIQIVDHNDQAYNEFDLVPTYFKFSEKNDPRYDLLVFEEISKEEYKKYGRS
ncbi:hypothetical protein KKH36_03780 [Patescibacteria group bacterium]|nr:hypothetical protein [Patescibacteria group bacterium]